MRDAYIAALTELTRRDRRVYSLVADNGAIVFDKYRAEFAGNFINFGISEANMLSAAAGMASVGLVPFTYTIASFITQRAFEQIRDDVCYQGMNVKIVGVGAGFAYSVLGPTHHAGEDIALMRTLPGMTIFSPADPRETYQATLAMADVQGPAYLRIASRGEPPVYEKELFFQPGRGVVLRRGTGVTIVATGVVVIDALEAAKRLEEKGISARVINIHTIAPFDEEIILEAARETGAIVTVEAHNVIGGLGSAVAETLARRATAPCRFRSLGMRGFCEEYDTHAGLKARLGLDAASIAAECEATRT